MVVLLQGTPILKIVALFPGRIDISKSHHTLGYREHVWILLRFTPKWSCRIVLIDAFPMFRLSAIYSIVMRASSLDNDSTVAIVSILIY